MLSKRYEAKLKTVQRSYRVLHRKLSAVTFNAVNCLQFAWTCRQITKIKVNYKTKLEI